jgi:hypothetical protein
VEAPEVRAAVVRVAVVRARAAPSKPTCPAPAA